MFLSAVVSVAITVGVFALSGARSLAYLFYFLAFVPFVTLDPESGGLGDLAALGGANVRFKMGFRLAASAGILALLVRRRGSLLQILRPACLPVVLFTLWALAGVPLGPQPAIAVLRLGELFVFFLTGLCLYLEAAHDRAPGTVARWHCLALLPLCLMTLYASWARPELAFHVGPGGLRLGHKLVEANVLGFAACVLTLWSTHEVRTTRRTLHRWGAAAVLVLSALVLVYARSRTAMLTAVVGQVLLWLPLGRREGRRRLAFAGLSIGALTMSIVFADAMFGWLLRGANVDDLLTATGRTDLWSALLREEAARFPLIGRGYLSLGQHGWFLHRGTQWTNAHNTYVFALVSTGLPGLLAILVITWVPLRAALRASLNGSGADRSAWTLLLALQVTTAITGLTGFGIVGHPNAAMLFHFALYFYCVASPIRKVTEAPRAGPAGRRSLEELDR